MRFRVAAFLVLASLLGIQACKSKSPTTYDFGVVAPFTGQEGAPVYGENIRNAVNLAVAEINQAGGVRGKKLVPHYEDSQLLAPVAVAAVQKLISVQHVSVIIGPVASSSTIAAAPIATQTHTILISPASTAHDISGISPYVFRTIAPDTYEADAMADFAWSKGFRKFAVAYVDNAGTKGPAEVFRSDIQAKGGTISAFQVVPQGSTDVRLQMTKLIMSKPDAVYLLGYALELGSMVRQFREQDSKTPILSFQVMEEPAVRNIAGAAAEGVIFTTPTIYGDFATGAQKKFIDDYRQKYGKDPGIFAANAYDAIYVLRQAIEAQGFNVDAIRQGILNIRGFDGASGVFDIDNKGDSNQKPRFMVIREGKLTLLQ